MGKYVGQATNLLPKHNMQQQIKTQPLMIHIFLNGHIKFKGL
jgi:hypothetical protein